jgi:hypothetical protein
MAVSSMCWQMAIRCAGLLHFPTLALACLAPIPPDWDANLASLPLVHRRFAVAQNASIGAMMAVLGLFSVVFAPEMVRGTPLARAVCLTTSLFWGGRLFLLPWLRVHTCLPTRKLRIGFALLVLECATYATAYAWLAIRPVA